MPPPAENLPPAEGSGAAAEVDSSTEFAADEFAEIDFAASERSASGDAVAGPEPVAHAPGEGVDVELEDRDASALEPPPTESSAPPAPAPEPEPASEPEPEREPAPEAQPEPDPPQSAQREDCPFKVGDILDERLLLIAPVAGKRHLDAHCFRAFDVHSRSEVEVTLRGVQSVGVARAAQLMARLDHPALAACLDVGSVAGLSYLVTERAGGPTLSEVVLHAGRFQPLAALRVLHGLARGLRHAERRGVPQSHVPMDGIVLERGGAVRLLAVELERRPPAECFARVVPALGKLLRALLLGVEKEPPADVPAALLRLADRLGERAELFDFTAVIASLELTAREALGADLRAPESESLPVDETRYARDESGAVRQRDGAHVTATVEVIARCDLRG